MKSYAEACNFTKTNIFPWVFPRFLNCENATKSCKASHFNLLKLALLIELINFGLSYTCPVNTYLFKINNKNTRKKCEICSLLTSNIFHSFF